MRSKKVMAILLAGAMVVPGNIPVNQVLNVQAEEVESEDVGQSEECIRDLNEIKVDEELQDESLASDIFVIDSTAMVSLKKTLDKLSECEKKPQTYTIDSYIRLIKAKLEANKIINRVEDQTKLTLEEVTAAQKILDDAIASLIDREVGDALTTLCDKLKTLTQYKESTSPPVSWSRLMEAKKRAEEIMSRAEDPKLTLKEVLDTQNDLKAAIDSLGIEAAQAAAKSLKDAQTAAKNLLKAESSTYNKGQNLYTDASWKAYTSAYVKLSKASGNNTTTWKTLTSNLTNAKKTLKKIRSVTAAIGSIKRTSYQKVAISIKKVSGAKGYLIYRSTKKSSGYKLLKMVESPTYVDAKATAGRSYYYKVVPINSSKGRSYQPRISGFTNMLSSSSLASVVNRSSRSRKISLSKVKNLEVSRQGDSLILKWSPIKEAKTIKISYSLDGKTGWKLGQSAAQDGKKVLTTFSFRTSSDQFWYKVTYVWSDGREVSTKPARNTK